MNIKLKLIILCVIFIFSGLAYAGYEKHLKNNISFVSEIGANTRTSEFTVYFILTAMDGSGCMIVLPPKNIVASASVACDL